MIGKEHDVGGHELVKEATLKKKKRKMSFFDQNCSVTYGPVTGMTKFLCSPTLV